MLLAALVFHHQGEPVGDFRKAWATASIAAGLGRFVCGNCKQTVDGHWCERAMPRRNIRVASSMTSAELRFATWFARGCRSGWP